VPDSPLITAGAQVDPSNEAPLHTNRIFTGLWTQRSPLRDAATPYLMEKFYSAARFDSLWGGMNVEISPRLTLVRRPGQSVYNNQTIPPVNRFYCFRTNKTATGQTIKVVASCSKWGGGNPATVRDVTGPSNNIVLFTKDDSADRTAFLAVGNILFMGDGVSVKKWIQSALDWKANSSDFAGGGDFIVDSNNNLQEAIAAQTVTITNIQVTLGPAVPGFHRCTMFFDPTTPLNTESNLNLTFAGMTTVPGLNGGPWTVQVQSPIQVTFLVPGATPITAYTTETGTATTGAGVTGAAQPVWSTVTGDVTQDNSQQWVCKGSAVQDWGFDGPAFAPTVTQTAAPSVYPNWTANTWYAPLFVIVDSNGNLQQLTTGGTLGGAPPVWNLVVGGVTNDNTAVWTNKGPGTWASGHVYAVGDLVLVTYSYFITVPITKPVWNGYTYQQEVVQQQIQITNTNLFQCTTAGTSGSTQPAWINGVGTSTTDNTVGWTNLGNAKTWATMGAGALVSTAQKIIDSNGYLETPTQFGKTGAGPAQPTWTTLNGIVQQGSITADGSQLWINAGPFATANTGAWKWAYSGKNSVTGHISNASPVSTPLLLTAGNLPVIQGVGPTDPQEDVIVLWRTVQGGSTLIYDDEFPNPGAGLSWVYTDSNADTDLNELIIAPINSINNAPPSDFKPFAYHEGRIWGFYDSDSRLGYTDGPDAPAGSGDEAMSPSNRFNLLSKGVWCWSTAIGLLIFRVDGLSIVLGNGTSNNPFYIRDLYDNIGLQSPDEITTRGNTCYFLSSAKKVLSLNTGQVLGVIEGAVQQTVEELELGFPIGDQFQALYTAGASYVTWHEGSSEDSALYVGDGAYGWFRMHQVQQPDPCTPWSPQALIAGGIGAVASIETSPGVRALLMGAPPLSTGPILQRDYSTYQDNGTSYAANAIFGSIVMAQPGSQASVKFITVDYLPIGSKPSVGVLYDNIEGTFQDLLNITLKDPVNQDPSLTSPAARYWAQQSGKSVSCRHMQVQISWPAENFANEMNAYTIYGRLPEKVRR